MTALMDAPLSSYRGCQSWKARVTIAAMRSPINRLPAQRAARFIDSPNRRSEIPHLDSVTRVTLAFGEEAERGGRVPPFANFRA